MIKIFMRILLAVIYTYRNAFYNAKIQLGNLFLLADFLLFLMFESKIHSNYKIKTVLKMSKLLHF